jgi:hypothetical protein
MLSMNYSEGLNNAFSQFGIKVAYNDDDEEDDDNYHNTRSILFENDDHNPFIERRQIQHAGVGTALGALLGAGLGAYSAPPLNRWPGLLTGAALGGFTGALGGSLTGHIHGLVDTPKGYNDYSELLTEESPYSRSTIPVYKMRNTYDPELHKVLNSKPGNPGNIYIHEGKVYLRNKK